MASADDLVEPVVLAADAALAGGARAEVCVRLLNADSSSSQPEALDHWRCR
jgi:anti-sigma factor ChrR (cupin superfamily)